MIQKIEEARHLRQVFEIVKRIKELDYTPKDFTVWLLKNIDKHFRIWGDIEEDEVGSFLIAQIVTPMFEDEVFIVLAYAKPKSPGVMKELLSRVEGWAMTKGIRKISAYVKQKEKAFCRKYGFEKEHIGLLRKLNY